MNLNELYKNIANRNIKIGDVIITGSNGFNYILTEEYELKNTVSDMDMFSQFSKETLVEQIYIVKKTEVEILEEDKDIEGIEIIENIGNYFIIKDSKKSQLSKHDTVIIDKINELVREVNKIKKGLK